MKNSVLLRARPNIGAALDDRAGSVPQPNRLDVSQRIGHVAEGIMERIPRVGFKEISAGLHQLGLFLGE